MMEVEKRRSKRGFFNLFDWNGKTRKKLFSSTSESTEGLPPKSAKSIPVTHHKLLSPIKTRGFIPTKNAAYIMEAAEKMIEASPRASSKSTMSSMRSASIPLRIRDLKEKMEAVPKVSRPQRSKEPSDAKHVKGRPGYKSYNGSDNAPLQKASVDSEKQSCRN